MKDNIYADDLALALELAKEADLLTAKWFRNSSLKVDTKPDLTPVTEADTAVERMIRKQLAAKRPDDAIVGEEFDDSGSSKRKWIIDPIDGTKNYARGNPVYATLIALEEAGETVVAAVSAPQLHKRWWAIRGGGAFANGTRIQVSHVHRTKDAFFTYGSLTQWQKSGKLDTFMRLHDHCYRHRGFGDFWIYMLVAEGSADIAVEPSGLHIWDIAAPKLIVQEAGGLLTNFSAGDEFDGSVLATNGTLHQEVLQILAS